MKTLLLFLPELTSYTLPYLSTPCLKAFMEQHGFETEQRDLNVEFMDYLLGPKGVSDLCALAADRLERLNAIDRLTPLEQRSFAKLFWAAVTPPAEVEQQVSRARRILKSEAFYSLEGYGQAMRALDRWRNALEGVLTWPGEAVHPDIMRYYDSSEVLINIVERPERNPYQSFLEQVLPSILERGPELVGISLVLPTQILPALTLGGLLKRAVPEVPIVVGGNICTRLADILPQTPQLFRYFDVAVIKEGERPLLALAREVASGRRDWSQAPNLIYHSAGEARRTPMGEPEEINALPTPDFNGLPLDDYLAPRRALPLYSCRGCHWARCAFCNIHMGYARFRPRNPELVLRDLETLHRRHRVDLFNFIDEAMPVSNLRAVADGVASRGLDIEWTTHARFDAPLASEELCRRLRRGGCTALYFGLESGSPRILELMDRGVEKGTASEVLSAVRAAGMVTHMNIILGVPGETAAEMEESVTFLLRHKDVLDSAYATPFVLARWAPIAQDPGRWGVTIRPSAACDLALLYQDFDRESGVSTREAEEFKWSVEERVSDAYPAFGLRLFGDVLPFAIRRFGTTDRDELLRLSGEVPVPAAAGESAAGSADANTISLAPHAIHSRLSHNLPRMRRLLANPLELSETLGAAATSILYDVRRDRLFKLSPMQDKLLAAVLGSTPDEAVERAAAALDTSRRQAAVMVRSLCRLTRGLVQAPRDWLEVD